MSGAHVDRRHHFIIAHKLESLGKVSIREADKREAWELHLASRRHQIFIPRERILAVLALMSNRSEPSAFFFLSSV